MTQHTVTLSAPRANPYADCTTVADVHAKFAVDKATIERLDIGQSHKTQQLGYAEARAAERILELTGNIV